MLGQLLTRFHRFSYLYPFQFGPQALWCAKTASEMNVLQNQFLKYLRPVPTENPIQRFSHCYIAFKTGYNINSPGTGSNSRSWTITFSRRTRFRDYPAVTFILWSAA